jgi:O-antigen/teichoic acid export membrane protein
MRRIPRNPLYVGLGLAVSGTAVYVFLALAGRALGPEAYAPLAVLWSLVFLAGPGLFSPIEQELGRALAARRAHGHGGGPVLRRAAAAGLGFAIALALAVIMAMSPLRDQLFDGETLLVVAFALSLVGYAAFYCARGTLAGTDRFAAYGGMLAGEALLRVIAGAVLIAVGVGAGGLGVVVALAPFAALVFAWPARREVHSEGPPAPWAELSGNLGWLLLGSLFTQVLVQAAPVAVKWLAGPDEGAVAGRLLAGLLLTRVPLYLWQALFAAMLPALSGLAAAGDEHGFRRTLARIAAAAATLCAVALVGTAILGPWALELLFGSEYALGRGDLLMLVGATAGVVMAQSLSSGLIALGRHDAAAWAWIIGAAVFLVVTALGSDLLTRVELGLLAGCVSATVAMAALLIPTITRRSWTPIAS